MQSIYCAVTSKSINFLLEPTRLLAVFCFISVKHFNSKALAEALKWNHR